MKIRMLPRMLVAFATVSCMHGLAWAQSDVADLQRQLQERDALVRSLVNRVEALERRLGAGAQAPSAAQVPQAAAVPAPPAAAAAPSGAVASVPAPAAPAPTGAPQEEELGRALERTLLREGGILLAPGSFELDPRFEYEYNGVRGLGIVQAAAGPAVVERSRDVHRFSSTIGLRAGLSQFTQVEARLPFVATEDATTASAAGLRQRDRARGVGDAEFQVTHQLAQDRVGTPALLASLNVRLPTGQYDPGEPSTGSGFATVQAALTAVKRQDPLVFVGGLSLSASRAESYGGARLRPGPALGIRAGTLLAVSPEASLRTGVELSRQGRTSLNGSRVGGTSSTSGVLELGFSTLLSKRSLLDFTLGVGITPDAPDFRLSVALPVRF